VSGNNSRKGSIRSLVWDVCCCWVWRLLCVTSERTKTEKSRREIE